MRFSAHQHAFDKSNNISTLLKVVSLFFFSWEVNPEVRISLGKWYLCVKTMRKIADVSCFGDIASHFLFANLIHEEWKHVATMFKLYRVGELALLVFYNIIATSAIHLGSYIIE